MERMQAAKRTPCSLEVTCSSAMNCFVCSLRQVAWLQCYGSALISSFGEQWQVGPQALADCSLALVALMSQLKLQRHAGPALGAGAVIQLPSRAAGEPGEEPGRPSLAEAELEALMCVIGQTGSTLGDDYVLLHTLDICGQMVGFKNILQCKPSGHLVV